MASRSSSSKRKRPDTTTTEGPAHLGKWRRGRRTRAVSRSGSPTLPATSVPGSPNNLQSSLNSRSPSPAQATSNSSAGPSASACGRSNIPWTGLHQALQALHISSKACSPLSAVIGDLAECLPIFEAAAKNRKDYEELASGLKTMVDVLTHQLNDETPESVLNSIKNIAEAIKREIDSVDKRRSRNGLRRVFGAVGDEEDLIRRYRRIEQLFRQLQGEASLSTWSISSKHFVNTQLEGLRPAKLAKYNSELSMEVSRRACTENTRAEILANLSNWSEDDKMASIYWMNGMAGTGKSTIAYSVCATLEERKQLAASFFCTRTSPECRDAKRIVPTIAYQLARCSTPFRSALCKALEEDPDINHGNISNQFNLLLKKPLIAAKGNMPNNLVVVVDALDECSDPYIVELFLGLLFRSIVDLPIKFFVTSRPEPTIRSRMMLESERSRAILYLHEIEQSLVQADIELYLREELAFMSPTDSNIEALAEHAGNLFIYAATAVRYIRPLRKSVNSSERLATVLAVNGQSKKKFSGIDDLYYAILTAAIDDDELELEEQEQMRLVIWTTVCACEPVLIGTLSAISGLKGRDVAMAALEPLRSVVHVSEHSDLVTTLHASFPDYILSRDRSGRFFCQVSTHNRLLSEQCFEIMKTQLRFNISRIQSSFVMDDEIPNLKEQIKANISEQLFYACRFWMDHLSSVDPSDTLMQRSYEFLAERFLFWMEVLNLKKCMPIGIVGTTKLNSWIAQAPDEHAELLQLASDAQNFVVTYASHPTSNFTPHIYLSALPLAPPSSLISTYYLPKFKGLIKVSGTALNKVQQAALGAWEFTYPIHCAALTPDNCVVLGDERGNVCVQNAHDGKHIVPPFRAHKKQVTSIGISNDGTQMVTGSHDRAISIWDAHNGSLTSGPFNGHTNRVTSVDFSPDASEIVSGSDDCTVGIWNSHDASIPMRAFTGHTKAVKSVAFSPDGRSVISGSSDYTIRLWDLSTGTTTLIMQGHTESVATVQFTPNGAYVVSGSNDHSICVWDVSNGALCSPPFKGHTNRVTSIALSPDGGRILSGSLDCSIRVWHRQTGELVAGPFEGHMKPVRSVGFSDDGARIISASDDKTVRVWNAYGRAQATSQKPGKRPARSRFHTVQVPTSASSIDQTQIAIVNPWTNIRIWNLVTATYVTIPTDLAVSVLQFTLDGTRMFSVHEDNMMYTWNTRTAELIDGPHRCSTSGDYYLAAPSIDGTRVVTFSRSGISSELWDVRADRSVAFCDHRLGANDSSGYSPRHQSSDSIAVFSLRSSRFLTCSEDYGGILNVWGADIGEHIAGPFQTDESELTARSVAFSPDETHIAYSSYTNNETHLIDLNTGSSISIPLHYRPSSFRAEYAVSVAFSSDSLYVASAKDGIYHIWSIQGLTAVSVLSAFNTTLNTIAYSPDNWCLITGVLELEDRELFQVSRFQPTHPPLTCSPEGWLIDGESRPWLWVPGEIRDEFPRSSGVVLEKDDSLCVDYSVMFVGNDWAKCYVGV